VITNQFTSSNGKWGLASTREDSFQNRAIPNPLLGFKADAKSTIVPFNTGESTHCWITNMNGNYVFGSQARAEQSQLDKLLMSIWGARGRYIIYHTHLL